MELLGRHVTVPCCDSHAHHGMNHTSRRCMGEIFWSAVKTKCVISSWSEGYMGLETSDGTSTHDSTTKLTN